MSKILSIQLNQDYKSFKKGFNINLEGNLIILSGINGSGKSQLFDIILKRRKHPENRQGISANIKLNDALISHPEVLCRTFKDNINISEFTLANAEEKKKHKDSVWNAYNNDLLNHAQPRLWLHQESAKHAKQILIGRFGAAKFNQKKITQKEINDTLDSDFIWRSDDIFTNVIGDWFFNYAVKVQDAEASVGRVGGPAFDPKSLPDEPPWSQLNNLFGELGFTYRFKDNYFIRSLKINEQPELYPIREDGSIDESDPRKLADLSDGEKAIISLSFASLSGVKSETIKILLLDEYDSTFNPSLTEIFYKVLHRYFISKGVMVIVNTHSAATISLAPDYASFYEVFKLNAESNRVLPVQREDYVELEVANKNFYDKISDQRSRIEELEKEKATHEKILGELKASVRPVIFTEGETDKIILSAAWNKLYPDQGIPFCIIGYTGAKSLCQYISNHFFTSQQAMSIKGLALFDFDNEGYAQWNGIKVGPNWEAEGFVKFSSDKRAFAMPLLVPPHLKHYVYTKKDQLHKSENLKLEMEHLFIKCNTDNKHDIFMALCPNAEEERGLFEIGKKLSTEEYQMKVNNFTAEDFENFEPLLEKLKNLLI